VATEISTQRPVWQELNAVQIRVALDDIEPPVWRRLVVPLGTTLADLHYIIQAAMGWTDSHMHEFDIGGLSYGDIEVLSAERTADDARVYDANEVRLRDFSRQPGTSFKYVYDYGDNWRHTITLEKVLAVKPAPKKQRVSRARAVARPRTSVVRAATSSSCACCWRLIQTSSRSSVTSNAGVAASSTPNGSISQRPTRRYADPCASNADGHNPSRREWLVSVVGYSPAEHPVRYADQHCALGITKRGALAQIDARELRCPFTAGSRAKGGMRSFSFGPVTRRSMLHDARGSVVIAAFT
jgi:hypothetical protein